MDDGMLVYHRAAQGGGDECYHINVKEWEYKSAKVLRQLWSLLQMKVAHYSTTTTYLGYGWV